MSKQPKRQNDAALGAAQTAPPVYPFAALVGQAEMKLALLLNVIEPAIGGALIMGQRGTGKSTAVRALADLLPQLTCVRGCAYNCDPNNETNLCADCRARLQVDARLPRERAQVPVVELPLNATEDRVCGTINFERAIAEGVKAFEPGLLARANRGFLYIDEVNLLEDHLVDLLLDAATTGRNRVEREGISSAHPARFVLIGSGNPEEGELRPQLLDRFGLYVEVRTPAGVDERVEIITHHEAFAREPHSFRAEIEPQQARLRRRLVRARRLVAQVDVARTLLQRIAELCQRLQVDGHRGELTITRAARALAAFEGRKAATDADVQRVAPLALRHRLRRDPLEQTESATRIEQTVAELFGADTAGAEEKRVSRSADTNFHEQDDDGGVNGRAAQPRPHTHADGRAGDQRGGERAAPPTDVSSALDLRNAGGTNLLRHAKAAAQQQSRARQSVPAQRGRYVRAVSWQAEHARLALDATLRVAATQQTQRRAATGRAVTISRQDFRFKQCNRRAGTLYIFAVDTSGSMALNRIGQAKGALAQLLRQAYVSRDLVALISFRERRADLLLRPSRSAALARRLLDALPVGGATPLAAGLLCAYELARQAERQGVARVVLLIFTDGRANVPLKGPTSDTRRIAQLQIAGELMQLGALLRRSNLTTVIVDTRQRFVADDEGARLAHALGGTYLPLSATLPPRTQTQLKS